MKRKIAAVLLVFSVFALSACGTGGSGNGMSSGQDMQNSDQGESAYHKITAKEAKKMMDEKEVTVVDVRTAEEYADQHIPGAILVPNETIENDPPELLPDKDAVILVHCRTGVRSKEASDKLVAMGYKNIYDFGGIQDWPYETESGEFKK